MARKFSNPSNEGRSKKAHIPKPPRKLLPKVGTNPRDELEIGQFTHGGAPALEKK